MWKKRIADPRILRLIRKWLKAGVYEEGQGKETEVGTPQGSGISPLLPQWTGDFDSLTVTILYSVFIDFIIQRELEKISRQQFNLPARRKFAQQLAWWL